MSGRGGRGGRGGWRGGRAGGRGGIQGPVLRDEDGNLVQAEEPEGPPPLFPEAELPEPPELGPKDQLLLLRRRDLLGYWTKRSPYFIEAEPTAAQKWRDAGEVERYGGRQPKRTKRERLPLSSVMTLSPIYFPAELFTSQDARRSAAGGCSNVFDRTRGDGDEALLAGSAAAAARRLEQLAEAEKRAGPVGKGGDQGEAVEEEGGEAGTYDEEEEDAVDDDDDYLVGAQFDDDDGYDDPDDGDRDEGAYY